MEPDFSKLYHKFKSEYEILNHMTENKELNLSPNSYSTPYHSIIRESSTTTKLRVAFIASSPTSSDVSFNDVQMVDPTVQDDLLSLLL